MEAQGKVKIPGEKLAVRVQTGGAELVQGLSRDWQQLCDESDEGEIFYRPEWMLAYLNAFAPQAKITVISAWAGERLRGVLPLMHQRAWITGLPALIATIPANIHCFRVGLVCCPGEEGREVLRALWQAMKTLPGWSVFDVSNVVEGNGIDQLVALARADKFLVARKRTLQTLYLSIAAPIGKDKNKDQPPWMAGTRPKFRSHLRRARRNLKSRGRWRSSTSARPTLLRWRVFTILKVQAGKARKARPLNAIRARENFMTRSPRPQPPATISRSIFWS